MGFFLGISWGCGEWMCEGVVRERLGFGRWDEVDRWASVEKVESGKWKVEVEVGRTSKFGGAVIDVRNFEMMDGVELISTSEKRKVWEERRGKEQSCPLMEMGNIISTYMQQVDTCCLWNWHWHCSACSPKLPPIHAWPHSLTIYWHTVYSSMKLKYGETLNI